VRELIALSAGALVACGGATIEQDTSDPAPVDAGEAETAGDDSAGSTGGEPVAHEPFIRANPDMLHAPFAVIDGSAETVTVRVLRDGVTVREYDPVHEGGTTAWLWGLSADTDYEAEAEVTSGGATAVSDRVAFTTGPLPDDLPSHTVTVHDPDRAHEGLVVWSTNTVADGDVVYVGVAPDGEILWTHLGGPWGGQQNYAGDLIPVADGRLMLYVPTGVRIIEPWGETVAEVEGSFHHHADPLPNGNYLFLERRLETHVVAALGGNAELEVDGVLEVDPTGATVHEWWASDHLDVQRFPSMLSMTEEMGAYDWTHGNAAVFDPVRQQVLLSLRHQHWVVGIDWPSGNVAWRLGPEGDFTLTNGGAADWFYAQHQPEVQPDGTLLLFDNGNERPVAGSYSRGVHLAFDPLAGTAEVLWSHRIEPMSPALGDADRLDNGNVLIVAGAVRDPGTPKIVEATGDAASEVVWELELGRTYRATHLPTHAGIWP
jgi:hypothetical protein